MKTDVAGQAFCANCGAAVSRRGPTPETGRRYCMKGACRAAKQADEYEVKRKPAYRDQMAPTSCTCCSAELPERPIRRGDSPLGRWCSKAACQRHRRTVEEEANRKALELAAQSTDPIAIDRDFLLAIVRLGDRLPECEDCGRRSPSGFAHPAVGIRAVCQGLGQRMPSAEVVFAVFPDIAPVVSSS